MRILNIDIETSPAKAYIWTLKTRYVSPTMIIEPKRMLCFAAKWVGEPKVYFYSTWHDGRKKMVSRVHDLLNEADAALHYNGQAFDVPVLNTEIQQAGLLPYSPIRQIDLYRQVTKHFAFMSNKLDEVSKALGTARKLEHEGFGLWVKVMAGDPEARKRFREYNIRDIFANEDLYGEIRPWISQHPSFAAMTGEHVCPSCESEDLRKEGFAHTGVSKFQRYVCRNCGKWSQDTRRLMGAGIREVAR